MKKIIMYGGETSLDKGKSGPIIMKYPKEKRRRVSIIILAREKRKGTCRVKGKQNIEGRTEVGSAHKKRIRYEWKVVGVN